MSRPIVIKLNRFFAALVDFFILFAVVLVMMIPSIVSFINALVYSNPQSITALYVSSFVAGALSLLFIAFYLIFLPIVWHGQTLGKRYFNLQIVKTDDSPVDFKCMFIRTFCFLLIIILTFGAALLTEILNVGAAKKITSVFDILASTKVVEVIDTSMR